MKLPINYEKSHWAVIREARDEYVKLQDGKCYHCGADLKHKPSSEIMKKRVDRKLFPDNFFKWPVHLHHCHKTGLTIGAVHNRCNAVLWQYHGE